MRRVFAVPTEQGHRIAPMALNRIYLYVFGLLFELASRVALVSFGMPASQTYSLRDSDVIGVIHHIFQSPALSPQLLGALS